MIKPEDYQKTGEIIASDQMMMEDIQKIFNDNPDFFRWYLKNFDHIGGWYDD